MAHHTIHNLLKDTKNMVLSSGLADDNFKLSINIGLENMDEDNLLTKEHYSIDYHHKDFNLQSMANASGDSLDDVKTAFAEALAEAKEELQPFSNQQ